MTRGAGIAGTFAARLVLLDVSATVMVFLVLTTVALSYIAWKSFSYEGGN